MKKTIQLCVLSFFIVSLAFIMAATSISAQDSNQAGEQNGEKFYMTKFCITCHGQKGISVAPNYPNLAKQNEQYLANQVRDIIKKKRANKLTLLMTENPVVNNISDEEIAAVATHLTNIKITK
ncbi:c-type cytochrome [Desulfococcaceae bacterium HSG7]|nr:c-type cytochrome [Desulfococcaceae bacterium HSG7]